MKPTRSTLAPVITLLSPSPAASRQAQAILGSIFGLQDTTTTTNNNNSKSNDDYQQIKDPLNDKFQSSMVAPLQHFYWDSVASQCPHSGAILHWLSVGSGSSSSTSGSPSVAPPTGAFELLSVTDSGTKPNESSSSQNSSIEYARRILACHFPTSLFSLRLRHWMNRPITADALLKRHRGLPVLDLEFARELDPDTSATTTSTDNGTTRLKEIAFTISDDAVYEDGSTLPSRLSQSHLARPVTGVYEWPNPASETRGLLLRPLPAAQRDLKGSFRSVVLTFHCDTVDDIILEEQQARLLTASTDTTTNTTNNNAKTRHSLSKIGFTGQRRGQLRVHATHNSNNHSKSTPLLDSLPGLDIRWCDSTQPTSMFHEASESLLASSLQELQSPNVLKGTGPREPGLDDIKHGASDCWMEVRTMVKNPRGLVRGKGPKIATAPPSYPE